MLTDEQDPSATGGIDRQPLPCGCQPHTPTRCDEALRLFTEEYLPAHRASQVAYAVYAQEITPANQAGLKGANLRAVDAWNAYADHLGSDYELQAGEHALVVLHEMETRLIGRVAAC